MSSRWPNSPRLVQHFRHHPYRCYICPSIPLINPNQSYRFIIPPPSPELGMAFSGDSVANVSPRKFSKMKFFVLIGLFLASFSALAQQNDPATSPHRRRSAPSNELNGFSELAASYAAKENQLSQLLASYAYQSTEERQLAQKNLKALLYELFDLDLARKRLEAQNLRLQLQDMQRSPSYQDRGEEIRQLQNRLEKIESNLRYRAQYREQIVSQRLQELL